MVIESTLNRYFIVPEMGETAAESLDGDPSEPVYPRLIVDDGELFVVPDFAPVGLIGAIYGEKEQGKTWVLMLMAVGVATGIPFLGKEVRQGPVLYIDTEFSQRQFEHRLALICNDLNVDFAIVKRNIRYCRLHRGDLTATMMDLSQYSRRRKDVLVIFDSTGFATESDKTGVALELIDRLKDFGSVIIAAHQAKPQDKSRADDYWQRRVYGPRQLEDICRAVWQIRKYGDKITLKHKYSNITAKKCPDIEVRISGDEKTYIHFEVVSEPENKPEQPKKPTLKKGIMMTADSRKEAFTVDDIEPALKALRCKFSGRRSIINACNKLVRDGQLAIVDEIDGHKRYIPTDDTR